MARPSRPKSMVENELLRMLSSTSVSTIGGYTLGRTVGEGSFGKVKQGVHKLTGQEVAIKVVDKIHAPTVVREIETWRHLHHPNIAQLYEVITTENKIYMVMEFCHGGEAFDHIYKNGKLDDTQDTARRIFKQIVEAVGYCHELNFVHRDLKLENILLTDDLDVKVIDFGFTREYQERKLLETYCGSTAYAAPEMIMAEKYLGPQADIWSLGVILYTLLCGFLPFDDENDATVHRKILNVDYELPDFLSPDSSDLIQKILKRDPKDRFTIAEIVQHPWLAGIITSNSQPSLPPVTPLTPGSRRSMYGGDRTPLGSTLEDAQLISALGVCGFDVENILASVQSDACDHLAGLWYLLLEKQRKNPFTGVISANIPRGRNGRDIPALLNASSDPSSPRPGSPGVTPTPADVERYLAGARRRSNAAESSRSAAALPAANGAAGSRRSMLLDVMRSNATPASGSSPPNGRYRGSGSGSRPQSGRRREGADGPASPRGPTIVEDEDDTGDAGLGTSPPAAMQQTKSQSGASRANRMGVKTPRGIVEEEEEEGDTSSAASSGAASRRVNGTSRYRATSPPSSGSPASPRDSSPRGGSSTRASSQASSPPRGSSPKVSRDVSPRAARTSALSPLNAQPTSTSNGADSPASYHSAISSHIQTQNASAHVSMHAAIDKLSGVPPTPSNAPRDEHSQGGGFTFPRPAIPSSLNPASLDRRPSNRQSPAANQVRSSAPPGSRAPNTPPVAHATPPAHAPRPDYVPPSPLPPPSPRLTNRTVRPSTPSSMSNSHTSTPTNMQPHSNGLGVSQSANAQLRASGGDSPLSLQTPSSSGAQLTQSSSNHSLRSNTSVSSQHSGVSYKSAPLTNAFGRTISAFTGHISPSSSHSKNHGGVNRTAGLSSEPNLVRTSSNDSDPIKGPAQDVTSSSSSTPGTSKNRSRSKSFSDGLSRNRFGLTVKALLKPASNGSSALSPQIVSPAINSPLSANPDRPDKSVGGIFNKFRRPSVAAQQYQQQQMQQEQMIQMMQQQQMQQMSPMYEFPGGHLSSSVPDDAAMNRGLPSEMTLGLGSASFPGASPMR